METRIVDRVWRGGETPGKYSYRISEVKLPVGREMTDLPAKISKQLSLKASLPHELLYPTALINLHHYTLSEQVKARV